MFCVRTIFGLIETSATKRWRNVIKNQNVEERGEKGRNGKKLLSEPPQMNLTQWAKSIIHHSQASMAICFNKRVKTLVKNREPIHSSFFQKRLGSKPLS